MTLLERITARIEEDSFIEEAAYSRAIWADKAIEIIREEFAKASTDDEVKLPLYIQADHIAKGVVFQLRYCEYENDKEGISTGILDIEQAQSYAITRKESV